MADLADLAGPAVSAGRGDRVVSGDLAEPVVSAVAVVLADLAVAVAEVVAVVSDRG